MRIPVAEQAPGLYPVSSTAPYSNPSSPARTPQDLGQDWHVGQALEAEVREALAAVTTRVVGAGLGAQRPCNQVAIAVPPANHAARGRGGGRSRGRVSTEGSGAGWQQAAAARSLRWWLQLPSPLVEALCSLVSACRCPCPRV